MEWERKRSRQCLLHEEEEREVWKILEEGDEEMQPFSGEKDLRSARP
jgi:hypothetical protein